MSAATIIISRLVSCAVAAHAIMQHNIAKRAAIRRNMLLLMPQNEAAPLSCPRFRVPRSNGRLFDSRLSKGITRSSRRRYFRAA